MTNSQGDIEELRHYDGSLIARYTYDTWGNTLSIVDANGNEITSSTALPVQNPFRYRGYYFDNESGLYYLQSRYYDPITCRFVNADGWISTGSGILDKNMFVYCCNNTINYIDNTGNSFLGVFLATVVAVAAITVINYYSNKNFGSDAAIYKEGSLKEEGVVNKCGYIESKKPGVDNNGITAFDIESGIVKNETKLNNNWSVSQSIVSTKATAEADFSGIPSFDLSGYISAYTITYDFTLDLDGFAVINNSFEFYFGSVSAGAELDLKEGKISISPPSVGAGYKWDFDIDWS